MQFQSAQALPTSGPGQLKALWTLLSYRTSNLIWNNFGKELREGRWRWLIAGALIFKI